MEGPGTVPRVRSQCAECGAHSVGKRRLSAFALCAMRYAVRLRWAVFRCRSSTHVAAQIYDVARTAPGGLTGWGDETNGCKNPSAKETSGAFPRYSLQQHHTEAATPPVGEQHTVYAQERFAETQPLAAFERAHFCLLLGEGRTKS